MTLRRKGLASHHFLIAVYGAFLLGGGILVGLGFRSSLPHPVGYNLDRAQFALTIFANSLRTGPRIPILRVLQDNKFLLWTATYTLMETVIRPNLDKPMSSIAVSADYVAIISMFGLGLFKHLKGGHFVNGAKEAHRSTSK